MSNIDDSVVTGDDHSDDIWLPPRGGGDGATDIALDLVAGEAGLPDDPPLSDAVGVLNVCAGCGASVGFDDDFCGSCGVPLHAAMSVDDDSIDDPPDPWPPLQPASFQPRLVSAVAELDEWATRWGVKDDPYVSGFSAAATSNSNLTMWANLDTVELLPEPSIRSGRGYSRLARVITIVRNVTVFVPVALTWLAINKATDAFGDYAASKPGESVNFLQFWQSGGDDGSYLSSVWRIQHIALVDTILISAIVVSTLIASMLESRGRAKRERIERIAERERVGIALKIDEALQGSRSASPESVAETLALAMNNLSVAARDVNEAAHRMETATLGMQSLGPQVDALSEHMAALSDQFSGQLRSSVEDLVMSVSQLGVTMGGDMHRFLTDVLAGIEEISERLSRTSVSVEFGTKMLRDDLDALHAQLSSLTRGAR